MKQILIRLSSIGVNLSDLFRNSDGSRHPDPDVSQLNVALEAWLTDRFGDSERFRPTVTHNHMWSSSDYVLGYDSPCSIAELARSWNTMASYQTGVRDMDAKFMEKLEGYMVKIREASGSARRKATEDMAAVAAFWAELPYADSEMLVVDGDAPHDAITDGQIAAVEDNVCDWALLRVFDSDQR